MNQLLEKFALKCGAWNQVYGQRNFMIDEHFDIEKFAELIVEECCTVTRRTILSGSGVDPDTFTGTVTTVQELIKHFEFKE
jgi:hypothetical protein